MARDYVLFPNDENGNTLWHMYRDGDDLSQPHEIEFMLSFQEQIAAERCALTLLRQQQKISVVPDPEHASEWLLTLYITLYPNYIEITELEQWLHDVAASMGASYQGWGCIAYVFDDEVDGHS